MLILLLSTKAMEFSPLTFNHHRPSKPLKLPPPPHYIPFECLCVCVCMCGEVIQYVYIFSFSRFYAHISINFVKCCVQTPVRHSTRNDSYYYVLENKFTPLKLVQMGSCYWCHRQKQNTNKNHQLVFDKLVTFCETEEVQKPVISHLAISHNHDSGTSGDFLSLSPLVGLLLLVLC